MGRESNETLTENRVQDTVGLQAQKVSVHMPQHWRHDFPTLVMFPVAHWCIHQWAR